MRAPAVAGSFYPAEPDRLRTEVADLLAAAPPPPSPHSALRALVVPHAGYVYSGPVAATAYRLLHDPDPPPERYVVLGPSHFVRFDGVATPGHEAWDTPLGTTRIDDALRAIAEEQPGVVRNDAAHAREHSLEVQLPFLHHLGAGAVLPLVTGDVEPATAAAVLGQLLDEPGVIAVISSDLSHYLNSDAASARDRLTAQAIIGLRPDDLVWDDACGRTAIQALLHVARARSWTCRLLDLRNSGDTAGGKTRVVGYGAFALG